MRGRREKSGGLNAFMRPQDQYFKAVECGIVVEIEIECGAERIIDWFERRGEVEIGHFRERRGSDIGVAEEEGESRCTKDLQCSHVL